MQESGAQRTVYTGENGKAGGKCWLERCRAWAVIFYRTARCEETGVLRGQARGTTFSRTQTAGSLRIQSKRKGQLETIRGHPCVSVPDSMLLLKVSCQGLSPFAEVFQRFINGKLQLNKNRWSAYCPQQRPLDRLFFLRTAILGSLDEHSIPSQKRRSRPLPVCFRPTPSRRDA